MKGSLLDDLKNISLTEICRLTIERWFCFFSSSRLFDALTLLSAYVFFEIGNTLFDGINQQLEILSLKYIH